MKSEILRMLRESDGYVSGQQLCEDMGVSRTAIWKVIKQLQEEGYGIEAVRNKGYHITEYPDVQSKEELQSLLKTRWAGHQIVYYKETTSTNAQAKAGGEQGAVHGTLVVADEQSAGKGRRGRSWTSPSGSNIYMSLLLRPELEPIKAPMLTLVMAYSIAEAIRRKEELNVKIKWPNDIVLHKKKVCGILTEMSTEIDYINYVVIGVGVNANMTEFPEDLKGKASSLTLDSRSTIKRAELIAEILREFEKNYEKFLEAGDLSWCIRNYNQLLVNQDEDVIIHANGGAYEAHAIGINKEGELLVEKPDKTIEAVFSGEVSVRGINGYV